MMTIPAAAGRPRDARHATGRVVLGLLPLILLVLACTGSEESAAAPALSVTVDASGAYPVVLSSGEPPAWWLEEVVEVGSDGFEGELGPDAFSRIRDVAVGPLGRIWVADGQTSEIRVFGPDGSHVRSLGGRGEGPGEIGYIQSFTVADDVVRVWDRANARVATFDSAGAWVDSWRYENRGSGSSDYFRFYEPGDDALFAINFAVRDGEALSEWQRIWPDSAGMRWLQPQRPRAPGGTIQCPTSDGSIHLFGPPYRGTAVVLPDAPGRSWVGASDRYSFHLIDVAGDTLRQIRRDRVEPPLTDEEWIESTADWRAFREEYPMATCRPLGGLERPATKGAWSSVVESPTGQLWVEVYTEGGTTWEVFDGNGALIGTLPGLGHDDSVRPFFGGTHVAWVVEDSLGVQKVRAGRIAREGRP